MFNYSDNSAEFHCEHLGADVVSATFGLQAGGWRQWGMIDITKIIPTAETVREGMSRAGLDFTPFSSPAEWYNPLTNERGVYSDKYIFNPAHSAPIGRVGADFNAMSYSEILENLFGDILDLGFLPARFISFGHGARMLAQFAFPESFYAAGREQRQFLTISSALDGSKRTQGGYTLYTPVCSNTYAAALGDLTTFATKRTKKMGERLSSYHKALGFIKAGAEKFNERLDMFARTEVTSLEVSEFIAHLMPKVEGSTSQAVDNRRSSLLTAIAQTSAEINNGDKITAYDLFAGITRYNGSRIQNRNQGEQMAYELFGPASKLADKALDYVNAIVR